MTSSGVVKWTHAFQEITSAEDKLHKNGFSLKNVLKIDLKHITFLFLL